MNWLIYLDGLLVILVIAVLTWLLSLRLRDVSIVDSAWSLMFLGAAVVYLLNAGNLELRNTLILIMVGIWAIRLSVHLTWRNWGEPEDKRYQEIREKYSPNFGIKSLFIIFLFQAVLAWIITMPLYASLTLPGTSLPLDIVGVALWLAGLSFESLADWQLARFKANPDNQGKVMDKGLWRYSRHPNYFGECLIWWGFYLLAVSSGGWWTIVAPLLITWLLLKFSGVVMLEQTIVNRRPAYADYIKRTNAFIPGPIKPDKTTKYQEGHAK
jgi:steroid 5-alpha reductase family enzyme